MDIGSLSSKNVVTVGPDHTLNEAARRMTEAKVGSAVVSTDDSPGIITERDLLRAIADTADFDSARVAEYMTANAITASESWDVVKAARCMREGGFRHLIVLNGEGRVTGMLSLRDLVGPLLDSL